jgi:hypothetical protein
MRCISPGAWRPDGKARRPSILGICEGGATHAASLDAPVPFLKSFFESEWRMKAVVAVGNAFLAFPRSLWARSWRPQVRQLPQPAALQSAAVDKRDRLPRRECLDAPALERRGRICAPARLSVRSFQWGVAPSSASTGVTESHGTSTNKQEKTIVDGSVVCGN